MMVRAEVVLICTDKGISSGLVSPAVYPFVFMIIILTSVLAPLFLKISYKNELPLGRANVSTDTEIPIESAENNTSLAQSSEKSTNENK